MQKLRWLLLLITVGAFIVPIVGVAIMHSDNLRELVIPLEIEEIMSSTTNTDEFLKLPQYVSSSYNVSSGTAQVTFNFTNPFNLPLTINSLSADLECDAYNFSLGHASLNKQVQFNEGETKNITIISICPEAADDFFLNKYVNATSIDIRLVNIQIDISGINIEIPEQVTINLLKFKEDESIAG